MVPALSAMARAAIAVRVRLEDIKQRLINRRAPRQRQFPRCSIHTLGSVRMLASARISSGATNAARKPGRGCAELERFGTRQGPARRLSLLFLLH